MRLMKRARLVYGAINSLHPPARRLDFVRGQNGMIQINAATRPSPKLTHSKDGPTSKLPGSLLSITMPVVLFSVW